LGDDQRAVEEIAAGICFPDPMRRQDLFQRTGFVENGGGLGASPAEPAGVKNRARVLPETQLLKNCRRRSIARVPPGSIGIPVKPLRRFFSDNEKEALDRKGFASQTSCGICGKTIIEDLL
jgi:hypothetical protein